MMLIYRIICLFIGYAFGLIQTSYLLGRKYHIDIRKVGSGNAGTTNTLRTLGLKAGLLVLVVDVLKAFAAVMIVKVIFRGSPAAHILPLLGVYAGTGCILGHNYPFYLGFKGGKGIAATLGMLLAIDTKAALFAFGLFLVVFFTTHYVSLGSMVGYVTAYILVVILGALGHYGMDFAATVEMDIILGFLTVQAIFRHRENIKRLINGNERKTYLKKKDHPTVERGE